MLLEYRHIAQFSSKAIFSSLSSSTAAALTSALPESCECSTTGIDELLQRIGRDRICLLDPKGEADLSPADADRFDYCLFGGILGDDPPRDRTGELRRLGLPGRRLGPVQMTTDTAVLVTSARIVPRCIALHFMQRTELVLEDGKDIDAIPYVDQPEIRFSDSESVEMPFRYVAKPPKHTEPILPEGMKQLLYDDMDRGFDDA